MQYPNMFVGQLRKRKTRRLVLSTRKPRRHVGNHYFYDANGMRLTKAPRRPSRLGRRRSPIEEQLVSVCDNQFIAG